MVDVVEVLVFEGDIVKMDDLLIMLESDKVLMEVFLMYDGVVKVVYVVVGDQVGEVVYIVIFEVQVFEVFVEFELFVELEVEVVLEFEVFVLELELFVFVLILVVLLSEFV